MKHSKLEANKMLPLLFIIKDSFSFESVLSAVRYIV